MARRAVVPKEREDWTEPEAPRQESRKSVPRGPLGERGLLWVIAISGLILLGLIVARHFDEYLRHTLEAKVNQRLTGYSVRIGHAHLSPFGLSLTLERLVIRQQANPQPPVADLPSLEASVEWREVLHGHLVADATFDRPRVHVNLPQLRKEAQDRMSLKDRGWQQAFESIYPSSSTSSRCARVILSTLTGTPSGRCTSRAGTS